MFHDVSISRVMTPFRFFLVISILKNHVLPKMVPSIGDDSNELQQAHGNTALKPHAHILLRGWSLESLVNQSFAMKGEANQKYN